jgi:hypothetical protein
VARSVLAHLIEALITPLFESIHTFSTSPTATEALGAGEGLSATTGPNPTAPRNSPRVKDNAAEAKDFEILMSSVFSKNLFLDSRHHRTDQLKPLGLIDTLLWLKKNWPMKRIFTPIAILALALAVLVCGVLLKSKSADGVRLAQYSACLSKYDAIAQEKEAIATSGYWYDHPEEAKKNFEMFTLKNCANLLP